MSFLKGLRIVLFLVAAHCVLSLLNVNAGGSVFAQSVGGITSGAVIAQIRIQALLLYQDIPAVSLTGNLLQTEGLHGTVM